ncbi:MAG: hypothetical protein MIO92_01960 [Methanosarcinaceae archaeon]|nr:hypothetical protein [Methanosarcinaceae archaeon]
MALYRRKIDAGKQYAVLIEATLLAQAQPILSHHGIVQADVDEYIILENKTFFKSDAGIRQIFNHDFAGHDPNVYRKSSKVLFEEVYEKE